MSSATFQSIILLTISIAIFVLCGGCSDRPKRTLSQPDELLVKVCRDVDYKKRTIFDLGRLPLYRSRSDAMPEPDKYDFMHGDSIIKALVYLDDLNPDSAIRFNRHPGMCYIDPVDTLSDDTLGEYRTAGYFDAVEEIDYYLHPTQFYLQFLRSVVGLNDVLGVYMEVKRSDGGIDTIGDISSSPLQLKLIKPKQYTRVNHHVWEYQWRNIYWLGAYNLDMATLSVDIYKGAPLNDTTINPNDLNHQEGVNYLQILGLDRGDNNGMGYPDGEIDRIVHIDFLLGYLYFPTRHPFDSPRSFVTDHLGDSIYLMDSVPEIYINGLTLPLPYVSRYYIRVTQQR